ncbi:MAG: hypothetical protein ACOX9R_02180 [Armatimonadota bacterium]|jgi:hypothetical protein
MRFAHRIARMLSAAALMLAVGANAAWSLNTEKLKFVANVTEERVADESEYDLSAALDGVWATDAEQSRWEITVNSDYDRSITDGEDYDRLKTWFRYLRKERPDHKWNPLVAISTDGDHDLDQVKTLVALGWRKHFDGGYVELTGGGSKDIQTAESWMGDVGALVQIEKDFGRFTWTVNPEVNYGLLGEVRFRDDRTLYSLRSGLEYEISDGIGIAYRLRLDNTGEDDRRHQMLGFSYSYAN